MHSRFRTLLRKYRLRTKILVATTLVVLVFMVANLLWTWVMQRQMSVTLTQEFSKQLFEKTFASFIYPMERGDTATVERELIESGKNLKGLRIYITDTDGQVIFSSNKNWQGISLEKQFASEETGLGLKTALDPKAEWDERKTMEFDEEMDGEPFQLTIKRIPNLEKIGDEEAHCDHCHGKTNEILGAMVLARSMKDVYSQLNETGLWQAGISVLVLVILVLLVNIMFSRMVTRRLGSLQEKTAMVAAGDVNVQVFDDGVDSIGRLTRDFNKMIKSIRDRMEYANSLKLGISDPFFMVDPEGRITFVNQAALSLVGKRAEEVLGKACQEVFLTEPYREQCPIGKALTTGESMVGMRIDVPGRKGREVPVICSAAVLKDSSGTVLGAFELMRDLSVEVEAERRLRDAYGREEKAKKVLEERVVELSQVLEKVSQGDFTLRAIASGANDTMDLLFHRVNETLEGMAALVMQVKHAILPVINGVLRISKENQSLSQRTEQQAAAMEEISATLEELVTNTTENLANIRHADGRSKDAVKVAHEGGDMVDKTAQAMAQMEQASHKVVEMMDLINEITFQTNLLSINAAVEAARAGEQGRGFAVVANEVRNLAKRSAVAAKDIQALVREIVEKVSSGRQWVAELQDCFSRIVATSGQVSDALGEVTMGSEESSRGIEQINQGTQEVCEVNEKNAAFVDELSQETQKLKEKARQLQEITSVFVLGAKDVAYMEEEAEKPVRTSTGSFPPVERRRARPVSRPLRDDLLHKSDMEEMNEDLLEREFEEGFEEF